VALKADAEELVRLRRENEVLKKERDFLNLRRRTSRRNANEIPGHQGPR